MAKLISKTYGEALFELAIEKGHGELFLKEIDEIRAILRENPDLDKLFKHPSIAKKEKKEMLKRIFEDFISIEMLGFLLIIIEKERYKNLESIFVYFMDKMKEENKIGVAKVVTAVELNAVQKDEVYERLIATTSYQKMEIDYQVDSTIIAGMTILIKGRVIDSSVRTKLDNLKKQLLQIQLG